MTAPTKLVPVREAAFQSAGLRVDRTAGVAYDVKVLGWNSRNGHRYDPKGCGETCHLYEGCKVNFDHPVKPGDQRPFNARFGRLNGPYVKDDGIYARELRFNPHHALAESFCWWAENDPTAIGLSHNATCQMVMEADGAVVYSKLVKVHSVDVVGDPATTSGLFEAIMDPLAPPAAPGADAPADFKTQLGELAKAILTDPGMDVAEMKKKLSALLKMVDDVQPDVAADPFNVEPEGDEVVEDDPPGEDDKKDETESLKAENLTLRAERDALKLAADKRERQDTAKLVWEAAGFNAKQLSDSILETLMSRGEKAQMESYVSDLRRLGTAPSRKPTAPATAPNVLTVDTLVSQLLSTSN
jgi:hypothetical protein